MMRARKETKKNTFEPAQHDTVDTKNKNKLACIYGRNGWSITTALSPVKAEIPPKYLHNLKLIELHKCVMELWNLLTNYTKKGCILNI